MNSPPQPSEAHIPVSSYPHVFPSRQGAVPVERTSATPADVSASQCTRPLSRDEQTIVACTGGAVVGAGGAAACACDGESSGGWARTADADKKTRKNAANTPRTRHDHHRMWT
jgi:hypothetical protein